MFSKFAFPTFAICVFHESFLPIIAPRYLIPSVYYILTAFIEISSYRFENVLQLISYKLLYHSLLIILSELIQVSTLSSSF